MAINLNIDKSTNSLSLCQTMWSWADMRRVSCVLLLGFDAGRGSYLCVSACLVIARCWSPLAWQLAIFGSGPNVLTFRQLLLIRTMKQTVEVKIRGY